MPPGLLGFDDDAAPTPRSPSGAAPHSWRTTDTGGRMMSDAPTAYALALEFDLVIDPGKRQALADRLAALVREGGYRIATGFVGHTAWLPTPSPKADISPPPSASSVRRSAPRGCIR